ncbi:MAG: hypothetical protein JRH20_21050 [Deltaproteobacteria bacterium]|nr:hypothetical protein [Deltaproteobacteria bacterium]
MMCKSALLFVLLLPGLADAVPQSPSPLLKLRAGQSKSTLREPRSARAYRQAVGAMGAAYCYQFSATLEALSAGWQRGGYKVELLRKRVRQTQGVARAVRKSLRAVELHLGGQDRETARGMILLLGLLVDQGDALVHFARTRSSKEGKHYTTLRQRARKKLRTLLAP